MPNTPSFHPRAIVQQLHSGSCVSSLNRSKGTPYQRTAMNDVKEKIQQFSPIRLQIYKEFWHALSSYKLNTQRLDDAAIEIQAGFLGGRAMIDRNSGEVVDSGACIILEGFASSTLATNGAVVHGVVKNFNTMEDFKQCDKIALFNSVVEDIKQAQSVNDINRILLVTYSDIKKFRFHYLAATPAVIDRSSQWMGSMSACDDTLAQEIQSVQPPGQWCWITKRVEDGAISSASVDEWNVFYEGIDPQHHTVAFSDPSSGHTPGWVLRNLLYYICTRFNTRTLNVFASRLTNSLYGTLTTQASYTQISGVGWEKNNETQKISPKNIDLSSSLDPTKLANQAVDLNLKLMKWRILPELNLDSISQNKCLLLGSGTLGCYVARGLMAWGVNHITLVDNGTVSYSNPVRQPLFEFEDCLDGGKPKAECAAERLRRIYPGVQAYGHSLSIPMPGHPFSAHSAASVESEIRRLESMIKDHDTVFLLTDSRESRWLPTLLGKVHDKVGMR